MNLHYYYDQLTDSEREIVDDLYHTYHIRAENAGLHIDGDDRAERVVDAMARQVIESRK